MTVEVIVPWTGNCPWRVAAWNHLRKRYRYPVTLAPGPQPWVKALAAMPAVEASDADVIVLADADVWADRLNEAIAAVEDGHGWAMPHLSVHRLTDESTTAYVEGADPATLDLDQRGYMGVRGGGIVVARRETLLDCPLDPRFVGWGQEDESFGMALACLHGEPWRPADYAPLWHLFHPPQERLTRARGSFESWELRRRYFDAQYDPERMRPLIEEAKKCLEGSLPLRPSSTATSCAPNASGRSPLMPST